MTLAAMAGIRAARFFGDETLALRLIEIHAVTDAGNEPTYAWPPPIST